jgi:predicted acyl esterase
MEKMIIERDVPILMDDGLVLKADVFRPKDETPSPVIMTLGVYGKGVPYRDAYASQWDVLMATKPEVLQGSTKEFMVWEVVDPEIWVAWGYVCVRVDSRGSGRSPGMLDIFSKREATDYYHAIEWAAAQPWSTGKVGLNGISYYAITQWLVASLQPPHLAAMIPWEGASDAYRDIMRHGGIQNNGFFEWWYPKQIISVQHGNPRGWQDPWLGERSNGPTSLSEENLERNRTDPVSDILSRPLDDEWYRSRSADWSKVTVPFLSAANWGGFGIHPRGNFEAFTQAASKQKWLDCHPGRHDEWFYLDHGMALQKRFLDHFLKGTDNGWDKEPPVLLHLRKPFSNEFEQRKETAWPLPKTKWTKLYLDCVDGFAVPGMSWDLPSKWSKMSFAALGHPLTFLSPPLERDVEITGPVAAKLFGSSTTTDMDLFLTLQAFHNGREIVFQGVADTQTPLSQGWLRASHRKLNPSKTFPYRPYHSHDELQPLQPGKVYDLDVEIWPTNILLPKGSQIALQVSGKDFERMIPPKKAGNPWEMGNPTICTHNHLGDRPADIFGGESTIFMGGETPSYILLPFIED